jgi:ClpP class serine protease
LAGLEPILFGTEAQRFAATSQTRIEIEAAWEREKNALQQGWPRQGHKLLFVIHEGDQGLYDEEATDLITEINLLDKHTPIDIVLHTHGGGLTACDRVSEALLKRKHTNAFVPFYAMSGGTKIALATETIALGNGASLGPIDVLYKGIPARDLLQLEMERGDKASEELKLDVKNVRRVLDQEARNACAHIHRRHKGFWGGCELADKLTNGERYHGSRITFKEARRLGIKVKRKLPAVLYELVGKRRAQLKELQKMEQALRIVQAKTSNADEPGPIGAVG